MRRLHQRTSVPGRHQSQERHLVHQVDTVHGDDQPRPGREPQKIGEGNIKCLVLDLRGNPGDC